MASKVFAFYNMKIPTEPSIWSRTKASTMRRTTVRQSSCAKLQLRKAFFLCVNCTARRTQWKSWTCWNPWDLNKDHLRQTHTEYYWDQLKRTEIRKLSQVGLEAKKLQNLKPTTMTVNRHPTIMVLNSLTRTILCRSKLNTEHHN